MANKPDENVGSGIDKPDPKGLLERLGDGVKAVMPKLIADSDGKPPWRLLLSTLRANQSIQVSGHALLAGDKFKAVRRSLPQVDDQFLSLVAKAGERLRELPQNQIVNMT